MKNIHFSNNWGNKLDKAEFTTIRKFDDERFHYYKWNIGTDFNILLNNSVYCVSELMDVITLEFSKIRIEFLREDTGLQSETEIAELFRRFRIGENDLVIILYFKKKNDENNR